MERLNYPYVEVGPRSRPTEADRRAFGQVAQREGHRRRSPVAARSFQDVSAARVQPHPEIETLPRWLLAHIERGATSEEIAQAMRDRLVRAPSEANQKLALAVANEIARDPKGGPIVRRHLTRDVFARVSELEAES
jgi:hypothetical protein